MCTYIYLCEHTYIYIYISIHFFVQFMKGGASGTPKENMIDEATTTRDWNKMSKRPKMPNVEWKKDIAKQMLELAGIRPGARSKAILDTLARSKIV